MKLKQIIKETLTIVAFFGWRSFGAFLVVLGGGAAAGGFAGNVWLGIWVTWLATCLGALAIIGAVIMFQGKVEKTDVANAWRKAGKDLIEKQDKE
jgi:hypothetical protein